MRPLAGIIALLLLCYGLTSIWGYSEAREPYHAQEGPTASVATPDSLEILRTIALGSCNRQDRPQDMWRYIVQNKPQLWIWLGDNIYGDTEDMELMAEKYRLVKEDRYYEAFRELVPVIGIWDDHDYGVNDGGKAFSRKRESKALMLDFLDVPPDAPVRGREGAYQAYAFGPADRRVKVILLDTRYFRDPVERTSGPNRRYLPNETGDILGEAQWRWLGGQLRDSTVQLFVIGSSIQVLPDEHRFEKWANFPAARQRLFQLLVDCQPAPTLLISGDRHLAELSRRDLAGLSYPLYELTSSGLTHSYEKASESNRHRVGPLIGQRNFGLLHIDWIESRPTVTAEVRGLDNQLLLREDLNW